MFRSQFEFFFYFCLVLFVLNYECDVNGKKVTKMDTNTYWLLGFGCAVALKYEGVLSIYKRCFKLIFFLDFSK